MHRPPTPTPRLGGPLAVETLGTDRGVSWELSQTKPRQNNDAATGCFDARFALLNKLSI